MTEDIDYYFDMVDECEAQEHRLTQWEQEFLESIRERLEEGRDLTPAQADKLVSIRDKVT